MAVMGSSAGSHLAALVGTTGGVPRLEGVTGGNLDHPSRVQAVVDGYGPTELSSARRAPVAGRSGVQRRGPCCIAAGGMRHPDMSGEGSTRQPSSICKRRTMRRS
ncbi:MAG: hypothetical protein ACRDXB_03860 [Actinomycetes bacterium]